VIVWHSFRALTEWKIHGEIVIGFWEYPLEMWLVKEKKHDENAEQPRVGCQGYCLANSLVMDARIGIYGYEEESFA